METDDGAEPSSSSSRPKSSKNSRNGAKARQSAATNAPDGEEGEGEEGLADNEGGSKESTSAAKPRRRAKQADFDEDRDREGDLDDPARTPRYQSNRAAAMVAKTKLNSRGPKPPSTEDAAGGTEGTPGSGSALKAKLAAEQAALQWVACDRCSKWRSLPSHVDMSALPEQWYCSMNKWDDRFNDCSIEQEKVEEPSDHPDEDVEVGGNGASGGGSSGGKRFSGHSRSQGGRGARGGSGPHEFAEFDFAGGDGGGEGGASAARRKTGYRGSFGSRNNLIPNGSMLEVEKVNWVQCNKCSKWRKVPGHISVESLPDVWQCSMNTWAPAFSKCAAKEETDDPNQLRDGPHPGNRSRRPSAMSGGGFPGHYFPGMQPMDGFVNPGTTVLAGPVKKVIQWVQCERRNCKKWRKLPGHVDMSQLPEKWFCEMNEWDLDRANCECPEDSDSEGEQNQNADTRSQLILANSKGPGTLSYRRIIFGTDGRVRPSYSEKNKNGFGIFSFTDTHRNSESDANDEIVEPTRRIAYWWSSAYDEAGVHYLTAPRHHPSSAAAYAASSSAIRALSSRDAPDAAAAPLQPPSSSSSSSSSTTGPAGAAAVDVAAANVTSTSAAPLVSSNVVESTTFMRPKQGHQLVDAVRKLAGFSAGATDVVYPLQRLKNYTATHKRTMLELSMAECAVVRSCLQSSPTLTLTLPALMHVVRSGYFPSRAMEACRASISLEGVRGAIQRLEAMGEVDVTLSGSGEIIVQTSVLAPNQPDNPSSAEPWNGPKGPPKIRKIFLKEKAKQKAAEKAAEDLLRVQIASERAKRSAAAAGGPTLREIPPPSAAPGVPTAPSAPVGPAVPCVPCAPAVPVGPGVPAAPTAPTAPTVPAVPSAPTAPAGTTVPAATSVPAAPAPGTSLLPSAETMDLL